MADLTVGSIAGKWDDVGQKIGKHAFVEHTVSATAHYDDVGPIKGQSALVEQVDDRGTNVEVGHVLSLATLKENVGTSTAGRDDDPMIQGEVEGGMKGQDVELYDGMGDVQSGKLGNLQLEVTEIMEEEAIQEKVVNVGRKWKKHARVATRVSDGHNGNAKQVIKRKANIQEVVGKGLAKKKSLAIISDDMDDISMKCSASD
ncbi:hypothetical protein FH972_005356 [Carpinus fangiana]|uniref:Uncharacterized protein n=1 Tax=Carpinus fangiana TaxID=176857 RepID=A0A5N6QP10_9ROSI|nr:hypothetical protein FH972_005356 [Carpinus fangiana]